MRISALATILVFGLRALALPAGGDSLRRSDNDALLEREVDISRRICGCVEHDPCCISGPV
ncbi:hypothetical protein BV25DRAFT_1920465 [Artomyces pyxidatus]|uniref:Uncharacterized protein n=1 Tax=Artomyces pyxidatus TaxID=48021 RepID=A0ACB8SLD4_9AGAM|nr:hypothetical protein BV25DRAFT_1920465 [Artomyces pyxidatus]